MRYRPPTAIEKQRWIHVLSSIEKIKRLETILDPGEAEAISYCKQKGLLLLIDERRGRSLAQREGVAITGTGAILLKAKEKSIINNVSAILIELQNTGYRFSNPLIKKIKELAQE